MFKAIYLTRDNDQFQARVADLDDGALPEGDVTVRVLYSTINYKDGLAIANRSPIVRKWPMVAGIDAAGVVESSSHADFKPGAQVILNGWGVGESHWGGLAQKARFRGDWLIPLPSAISPARAMAIGTAGYTAMLCAMALEEQGVPKGQGDVLVTGASGGVGSVATAILSAWGYRVVASTGKMSQEPYLREIGASEVIDRAALSAPGKPMQKERWAAVVDSVGSHTLANALAQTRYGGAVAACGLAQGGDLPASVLPFILRAVKLIGIDSVMAPKARRMAAWDRLARDLDLAKLDAMTTTVGLADALKAGKDIVEGTVRGRIVVDVNR